VCLYARAAKCLVAVLCDVVSSGSFHPFELCFVAIFIIIGLAFIITVVIVSAFVGTLLVDLSDGASIFVNDESYSRFRLVKMY